MNASKKAARPEQDGYKAAISRYVASGGRFIVLTDDVVFAELVRSAVHHILGLPGTLSHITMLGDLFALLHQDAGARHILLLDRSVAGSRVDQVLGSILRVRSTIRIIMATQDVDRYSAVLLVEHGAHNIITKPGTIGAIIEKLAFTIGPQGKFGKLIDKGKKLLEAECWDEALLAGEQILAQKPGNAAACIICGDAFIGLDMPEKAEAMFIQAVESEKMYLAPLKRLADFYERAGDAEKQLAYLRRLHAISPLNTERMLRIGELEIARGGESAAGEMFESALEQVRKEAADHEAAISGKIADICSAVSPEMAIKYSRKSLELRGGTLSAKDIAAVNVLGIVLRKQGKWREAMEEYQKILDVAPGHSSLVYNMALACSEGGDAAQAHTWMLRALELDPDLPASGKNVAFNIGTIFQKAGFDGLPFFRKAHELDPGDERIQKVLERLQRAQNPAE